MPWFLTLLLASAVERDPALTPYAGAREAIVASVDHSEWTPARSFSVDLETGKYAVIAPTPWPTLHWPYPTPVRSTFSKGDLKTLRALFADALSQGLTISDCKRRLDEQPNVIVMVSNAGTPWMTLFDHDRRLTLDEKYLCWTPAAQALEKFLQDYFEPRRSSRPRP